MYEKFGVELEEYNLAFAHHRLIDDPEVVRILKATHQDAHLNASGESIMNTSRDSFINMNYSKEYLLNKSSDSFINSLI